jgi:conjugative transfer region protein TrbK
MDGKMLARLGAIVFVSFAITATAIEMTRKDAPGNGAVQAVEPARDPLREGQRRCQQLGQAGERHRLPARLGREPRPLPRPPPAPPPPTEGR